MTSFVHQSVLLAEAIAALHIKADGTYVDCTVGGAGHSMHIAQKLGAQGKLLGLDQDATALAHATDVLRPYAERVTLVKSNFRHFAAVLAQAHLVSGTIDGVLFDLGVSSPQLDDAQRGFTYWGDAPLDMRMDMTQPLSAQTIVQQWPEEALRNILWTYGEEKFAQRIAQRICHARQQHSITTAQQLVDLIKESIPAAARREGGHPARRTFQALRIAVNDELEAFRSGLEQAFESLAPQGRLVVITFHSLEDRICKQFFLSQMTRCTCPPDFPLCVCHRQSTLKLLTKKPIVPDPTETLHNPRARSAKLRVVQKK